MPDSLTFPAVSVYPAVSGDCPLSLDGDEAIVAGVADPVTGSGAAKIANLELRDKCQSIHINAYVHVCHFLTMSPFVLPKKAFASVRW